MGFADIYNCARPSCPEKAVEYILNYMQKTPSLVIDLGCGTGLSSLIWKDIAKSVIGVEPSADMRKKAEENSAGIKNISYISAFAHETGLESQIADVITCSQSFHWMPPEPTLKEVDRLLKDNGIFAVYDCDWPPVCHWEAEAEYGKLLHQVNEMEEAHPELKEKYSRWDKSRHLYKIKNSGYFRYVREIVFSNTETFSASRFLSIALSQGGLQSAANAYPSEMSAALSDFCRRLNEILGEKEFNADFCYRMRIAVK